MPQLHLLESVTVSCQLFSGHSTASTDCDNATVRAKQSVELFGDMAASAKKKR